MRLISNCHFEQLKIKNPQRRLAGSGQKTNNAVPNSGYKREWISTRRAMDCLLSGFGTKPAICGCLARVVEDGERVMEVVRKGMKRRRILEQEDTDGLKSALQVTAMAR